MKVLVVGSGGREHALCWSLAASPLVDELLCAPGNPGIAQEACCHAVAATDLEGLCDLASRERVDLVVVGPEQPLVLGLVDRLQERGIKAFGPTAAAARLEGSKAFMKAFAARHGIPTAAYRAFDAGERDAALAYVRTHQLPVVIKADGLAAGKGVVVAETHAMASEAVAAAFAGAFGEAGSTVVVEAFLDGEEASLFALCDGRTALEIGTAQDHKRAFDGDVGPNTGGMGAYSPAPILDKPTVERVMRDIVEPTIAGMAAEGAPFTGFLYVGLMLGRDGPKLVEFNVRFGDPECQVVLPRLRTDLGQLLLGACDGQLSHMSLRWRPDHALTVVMASRGYPGAYEKGSVIKGIDEVAGRDDVLLFHAGTARRDGHWLSAGGRVLDVTATGPTLLDAQAKAYAAVETVDWPDGFYRSDIGWRALGPRCSPDRT